MPDLTFIQSNPAVDEFNRANKLASDEQTAQLDQQGKQLTNQNAALALKTNTAAAPLKLRQLTADTSTAETNAQYAPQNAQANLAEKKAQTANAYSEISNRDAARHMEVFTKSLALANAGDIAGAKAIAAQNGETIPDAVLSNAAVRSGLSDLTTRAQQLYPNRPKDQMVWLHSHISTLSQAAASGQPVDPTAAYQQMPGDPEPPEIGGMKNGETQQIISTLMQSNPGMTYEQALSAAHGRADEAELKRESLALNAAKADQRYADDPNATLAEWRQKYGLQPMPGAPGAAPPRPQTIPQGSAYSPSRKMWRDPQGNLYDANGQQLRMNATVTQGPAAPTVPMSQ